MKITVDFLKSKNACLDAIKEFEQQKITEIIPLLKKMIKLKKLDWANWLIVRCMIYKQYVSYAVYAAEQVIDIFEKKYPDDKRPRLAIEAAKRCIENPSKKNKAAAYAAYATAYAAANAAYATAYAAANAANATAYATAYAAAYAANATAYAAYATAYAAYAAYAANAANAAAYAAYATAYAAANAANAAYATAYAAYAAYTANAAAYAAAKEKMKIKILRYGIELLEEK